MKNNYYYGEVNEANEANEANPMVRVQKKQNKEIKQMEEKELNEIKKQALKKIIDERIELAKTLSKKHGGTLIEWIQILTTENISRVICER